MTEAAASMPTPLSNTVTPSTSSSSSSLEENNEILKSSCGGGTLAPYLAPNERELELTQRVSSLEKTVVALMARLTDLTSCQQQQLVLPSLQQKMYLPPPPSYHQFALAPPNATAIPTFPFRMQSSWGGVQDDDDDDDDGVRQSSSVNRRSSWHSSGNDVNHSNSNALTKKKRKSKNTNQLKKIMIQQQQQQHPSKQSQSQQQLLQQLSWTPKSPDVKKKKVQHYDNNTNNAADPAQQRNADNTESNAQMVSKAHTDPRHHSETSPQQSSSSSIQYTSHDAVTPRSTSIAISPTITNTVSKQLTAQDTVQTNNKQSSITNQTNNKNNSTNPVLNTRDFFAPPELAMPAATLISAPPIQSSTVVAVNNARATNYGTGSAADNMNNDSKQQYEEPIHPLLQQPAKPSSSLGYRSFTEDHFQQLRSRSNSLVTMYGSANDLSVLASVTTDMNENVNSAVDQDDRYDKQNTSNHYSSGDSSDADHGYFTDATTRSNAATTNIAATLNTSAISSIGTTAHWDESESYFSARESNTTNTRNHNKNRFRTPPLVGIDAYTNNLNRVPYILPPQQLPQQTTESTATHANIQSRPQQLVNNTAVVPAANRTNISPATDTNTTEGATTNHHQQPMTALLTDVQKLSIMSSSNSDANHDDIASSNESNTTATDNAKEKNNHPQQPQTCCAFTCQNCHPNSTNIPANTNTIPAATPTNVTPNPPHQPTSQPLPKKQLNRQKFLSYVKDEMLGSRAEGSPVEEIDANMTDFLRVPSRLEGLLFLGVVVCVDSFLYALTFLPLKCVYGIVCLIWTGVRGRRNVRLRFHRRHAYQLLQVFIIITIYNILLTISVGKLYHWIRGQSMLKLYVLIAIVEIFDRLLCSFGQDAMDSLYWNTTRRPRHIGIIISTIVVLVYVLIHSIFIFVHIATLNVAMNSADSALLTLLISGNFAEIKSTVFKKYTKQTLFKITTSDICERFKLVLFLSVILLLNLIQSFDEKSRQKMLSDFGNTMAVVTISEIIADWVKHSFITKFNFIKSGVYYDYALIIAGDVTGFGHEGLNLDHTHAVVKRVGLAQVPLLCVLARYIREALRYSVLYSDISSTTIGLILGGLFVCLLVVKVFLGVLLTRAAGRMLDPYTTTSSHSSVTPTNTAPVVVNVGGPSSNSSAVTAVAVRNVGGTVQALSVTDNVSKSGRNDGCFSGVKQKYN